MSLKLIHKVKIKTTIKVKPINRKKTEKKTHLNNSNILFVFLRFSFKESITVKKKNYFNQIKLKGENGKSLDFFNSKNR